MSFVFKAARPCEDVQADRAVAGPGHPDRLMLTPPAGKRRHCWLILTILAASLTAVTGSVSAQTGTAPFDPAGCSDGTWVTDPAANPGLVADCIALVAIRNHFKSNPANADIRWNSLWRVTNVDQGRVVNLELNSGIFGPRISGTIPPEIGNLTNLTTLNLSSNKLTGPIPSVISNLTNLTTLNLADNQLTGDIPAQLGNLTNLTTLDLSGNELSGTIPPEIGNLTNLTSLSLHINKLTGSIPPEIGNLTNLTLLNLFSNQLSGSIPPEIGNLTNLSGLDLHSNKLTGPIPPGIGNFDPKFMDLLSLHSNKLTGPIPPEIGNLTNLTLLYLSNNQLSGTIPLQLGNLEFVDLFIHNNQLSGEIPGSLGVNETFRFCHNQLTGALPVHLRTVAFDFSGDVNDISSCYEGTFRDDDDNTHRANIEQIADWGITQGCGQDRFCPSRTVTRAQMAAFLHRAVTRLYGEPDTAEGVQFTDVGPDVWYRSYAQWAAANGVIGTPGGDFNPQGAVTRADMAEMLVAAFDNLSASPKFQGLFSDVAGIPHATIRAMEGIYDAGVTTGCGTAPLRYCPTKEVTRAQMASFLVRAVNLASGDS